MRNGLSPRVRGNPTKKHQVARPHRSIPACAGEPEASNQPTHRNRVYPRVCGGTRGSASGVTGATGLSPRVRGNREMVTAEAEAWRSIPACAGEPHAHDPGGGAPLVYPRVCGGTSCRRGPTRSVSGLSPRVRGNLEYKPRHPVRQRSIPACAGEPLWCSARLMAGTVYPRVCGGTTHRRFKQGWRNGLSPRVRGNLQSTPRRRM